MKRNIYFGLLALAVVSASAIAMVSFKSNAGAYSPRTAEKSSSTLFGGAGEYMHSLRANQITGEVNPGDVEAAWGQIKEFKRNYKASFPLTWSPAGPDNIGGRTRAVLVDRNDPKILYAGGVNGGLFRSTNKGASWYPINDKFQHMTVSSICQTVNGDIYFGTGESFTGSGGQKAFTPGFVGGGIYRSSDNGETFERIVQTSSYNYVNKLASHPTKNVAFAATNAGLFASADGDHTSWTRVLSGNAQDVVIDKNGNALAYTNRIYRSTDPTNNGSYELVDGLPIGGVVRAALAYSPSDPNYAYVVIVGPVTIAATSGDVNMPDGLVGVYQSTDNGSNFSQIVGKANAFFAPFSITQLGRSQGRYDVCIAVHPRDKERVFIGGIQFSEWSKAKGPTIVGNTNDSPFNPFGIHSDKHVIVFDTVSSPMIMYIGNDGGVAKTTNAALTNYAAINNGYATTQFYGIAAGTDGAVMGGCQDNSTIYINGKGSTEESGEVIFGGDGFNCEISRIDPKVLFVLSQFGNLGRTLNAGGNASTIWDPRITEYFAEPTQPSNIFNTPLALWENEETEESMLYFALDNEVWVAKGAVRSPNPEWFRVANIGRDPHAMELVPDGSTLFVAGLNGSSIYRVDGLNNVVWDTAKLKKNAISDSISTVSIRGNLPARTITDIEVDQSNPNRVIVTMGNYGNSAYVYITENAMDDDPTWRSIQTNLPNFPVYDAEISVENPNEIILGTEFGIYACLNGSAPSPSWTENNDDFPLVPVFQMRQVEAKRVEGANAWRTGPMLYAGTHGRGIYKTSNLLTSARPVAKSATNVLKVYPNPANSFTQIDLPNGLNEMVKITVVSISGQTVLEETYQANSSNNRVRLNTAELKTGNYFIKVEGNSFKASSRFVKTN